MYVSKRVVWWTVAAVDHTCATHVCDGLINGEKSFTELEWDPLKQPLCFDGVYIRWLAGLLLEGLLVFSNWSFPQPWSLLSQNRS